MLFLKAAAVALAAGLLANAGSAPAPKWRAILEPAGNSQVRGGATAEAKDGSTHFIISIRNAPPNSSLAWHMHTGTCASPGGIQGSGFPALQVGPGGTAQAAVTIAVAPPETGSYIIQVHGGGGVVACGELKAVTP